LILGDAFPEFEQRCDETDHAGPKPKITECHWKSFHFLLLRVPEVNNIAAASRSEPPALSAH
jgi:hypothetical protein